MKVFGIVMAGGGGTRFWPLSRKNTPKQLLNLDGKDAMIGEAVARLAAVSDQVFVVTNRAQAEGTKKALGGRVPEENILLEPAARNTAACIGYAAAVISKRHGDGIMAVTPSDAYIRDPEKFAETLKTAISAAETGLATIGIPPTFPATGYGYVRCERSDAPVKRGIRFVEKPNLRRAKRFLQRGDYLWNSGMFFWRASEILEKYRVLLPELYAGLAQISASLGTERERETVESVYPLLPSVSVDRGIMEKSKEFSVVVGDFGWSDVGSWDMLGAVHPADPSGNVVVGDGLLLGVSDSVVYAGEKLIAAVGVKDLIIVDTPNALLVCPKKKAQEVKRVVEELEKRGREDLI